MFWIRNAILDPFKAYSLVVLDQKCHSRSLQGLFPCCSGSEMPFSIPSRLIPLLFWIRNAILDPFKAYSLVVLDQKCHSRSLRGLFPCCSGFEMAFSIPSGLFI